MNGTKHGTEAADLTSPPRKHGVDQVVGERCTNRRRGTDDEPWRKCK